jgi:hypothetical protein
MACRNTEVGMLWCSSAKVLRRCADCDGGYRHPVYSRSGGVASYRQVNEFIEVDVAGKEQAHSLSRNVKITPHMGCVNIF